jgi:hypothetical protein
MDLQSPFALDYKIKTVCPVCRVELLTVGNPVICEICYKNQIMKAIKNEFKDFKFNLSPKKLVINAIKSKLSGHNIERIILTFSLIDEDRYNIAVKPLDDKEIVSFILTPKDTSLLKKIFVTKIYRTLQNPEDYKAIILQCDLKTEDFDIFLQNKKNDVTKYEFQKTN